ncbi:MAG: ferritin-like domain-containing protein [Ferruginibacter sp.]
MRTSKEWKAYFEENALQERVDWTLKPIISPKEIAVILKSLQAWQLGETSDGAHLIRASILYATAVNDTDYVKAVRLFIKEEQKHGNNLGRYLDAINQPRIKKDWGDSLFRRIRYFNTNMEIWTLAVITVESAAQVFYQSLKDATSCTLLKQVCTDILIDESHHIDFQKERMTLIFSGKSFITKLISRCIYPAFFFATSLVVWFAHKKLFKAGGINFTKYRYKMKFKYLKTLQTAAFPAKESVIVPLPKHTINKDQKVGAIL